MPRLHERIDGSFYIRIFRGEDKETGEIFVGTWQLSLKGEDRLHSYGIRFDDDHIPMHVFKELIDNREIWNDDTTGGRTTKPRRKKVVRTRVKKSAAKTTVAPSQTAATKPTLPDKPATTRTKHVPPESGSRTQTARREPENTTQRQPDLLQQFIDFVRSLFRP
jgi:hypothetical protein